jgi:hypothetical protein
MKLTKIIAVLLAPVILALAVSAATPTPASKPSASAKPSATAATNPSAVADKPTPAMPSPSAKPTPADLASPMEQPAPNVASTPANAVPPKPVLYLMQQEPYTAGGKNWIRYRYDVLNKADYPADMFAAAPSLPPCGSNTNASRTWVDFFDSTGKRLYGFCALSKPADLGKIWFAMEEGVIPPSYVYIELNDRQTNTKYKSNLADTTI